MTIKTSGTIVKIPAFKWEDILDISTLFGTAGDDYVAGTGYLAYNVELFLQFQTGAISGGSYTRVFNHPFIVLNEDVEVETAIDTTDYINPGNWQAAFLFGNNFWGTAPTQYTDALGPGNCYAGIWFVWDGIYNGRFLAVTRDNAGATITDMGVGSGSGYDKLKIVNRQTHVDFYINGVLSATHTTHLPWATGGLSLSRVGISTQNNVDQGVVYYYFRLTKTY
jgi:hypothetical protein